MIAGLLVGILFSPIMALLIWALFLDPNKFIWVIIGLLITLGGGSQDE